MGKNISEIIPFLKLIFEIASKPKLDSIARTSSGEAEDDAGAPETSALAMAGPCLHGRCLASREVGRRAAPNHPGELPTPGRGAHNNPRAPALARGATAGFSRDSAPRRCLQCRTGRRSLCSPARTRRLRCVMRGHTLRFRHDASVTPSSPAFACPATRRAGLGIFFPRIHHARPSGCRDAAQG